MTSMKQRLSDYLGARVGQVITTEQLRKVAEPGVAYQRRIRELRESGWQIETNRDDVKLLPGQYRLVSPPPDKPLKIRNLSTRLRAEVLERNGFTCRACGQAAGDMDPETGRAVVLHIAHIQDRAHGGKDEIDNLRAFCARCNEGAKHLTQEPPTWTWLLGQIRRAKIDDQRKALEWLRNKLERKKR